MRGGRRKNSLETPPSDEFIFSLTQFPDIITCQIHQNILQIVQALFELRKPAVFGLFAFHQVGRVQFRLVTRWRRRIRGCLVGQFRGEMKLGQIQQVLHQRTLRKNLTSDSFDFSTQVVFFGNYLDVGV